MNRANLRMMLDEALVCLAARTARQGLDDCVRVETLVDGLRPKAKDLERRKAEDRVWTVAHEGDRGMELCDCCEETKVRLDETFDLGAHFEKRSVLFPKKRRYERIVGFLADTGPLVAGPVSGGPVTPHIEGQLAWELPESPHFNRVIEEDAEYVEIQ